MAQKFAAPGVNLNLLSVLLVEDNPFVQKVFLGVLRALGIEHVATAENGAEAIKIIEKKAKSVPPGTAPFDLIFLDIFMPEVNGFMTLRWLRSSAQTPDRFLPVAVISGAADTQYVQQARDLGMNEFIGKPFSMQSVWERIVGIIYRPRRFVLAPGYFGPERRRVKRPIQGEERRLANEADIQVVRNSTKKLNMDSQTVMYFEFPNRLSAKVGGLAQGAELPKIDPAVLAEVEGHINAMSGDYSIWVADEIGKLVSNLLKLREEGANIRVIMSYINASALEMRSQGGLFGYPLVTEVSKSLFHYTNKNVSALSDNEYELLKAHVDAIKVIIAQKIGGDGGESGQALLAGLQAAIRKYS